MLSEQGLKVNENRNHSMKTSFEPKAEILTKITLLFGPNDVFIKPFQYLLTFTG